MKYPVQTTRYSRGGTAARRRVGGYALLLTLILLTLTAVTIGTLARTSSTQALQAIQAERDLQLRWAELSCRRVLLPAMQTQLTSDLDRWRSSESENTTRRDAPLFSMTTTIEFRGIHVVARLDDQQALPNLNTLLAASHNGQPADVHALIAQTSIRERLVPRPLDEATARRIGAGPYDAWGQLFPAATPPVLSGMQGATNSTGIPLTLWGDGRLNVWTASPESLHLVLDDRVGTDQVAKLLELRAEHRERSVRELIQMMNLGPSERAQARLSLTDRSRTYALWLSLSLHSFEGETSSNAYTLKDSSSPTQWSLTISENSSATSGSASGGGDRGKVFRW